jgi:hypothetical protein
MHVQALSIRVLTSWPRRCRSSPGEEDGFFVAHAATHLSPEQCDRPSSATATSGYTVVRDRNGGRGVDSCLYGHMVVARNLTALQTSSQRVSQESGCWSIDYRDKEDDVSIKIHQFDCFPLRQMERQDHRSDMVHLL